MNTKDNDRIDELQAEDAGLVGVEGSAQHDVPVAERRQERLAGGGVPQAGSFVVGPSEGAGDEATRRLYLVSFSVLMKRAGSAFTHV